MDSFIGHENVRRVFDKLLVSDRLSHAYLVVGPDMVGKSSVIKYLASRLLGASPEDLKNHPDVVWVEREIDPKSGARKVSVTVDQIRSLRERLSMSSFSGGYKIAVIADAEAMNQSASNALLKVLEDAPKKTVIFLRASSVDNLPKTIVSRAQVFYLSLVSNQEIVKLLIESGASAKEAEDIANLSYGRPGVALKLLNNRGAYKQRKDDMEFFSKAMEQSISDRMKFAKSLASGDQTKSDETGCRVFQNWEMATRTRLIDSVNSSDMRAQRKQLSVLEALAQSKKSLSRYTPLQLAFEHTLLHL